MSIIQSSLKTKKLIFKNRLIFPPIATNAADENGMATEKLLKYYGEKTRGGYISMAVLEHCFISPRGRAVNHQLMRPLKVWRLWLRQYIKTGLRRLHK